jgi:hypothetical protein
MEVHYMALTRLGGRMRDSLGINQEHENESYHD